MPSRAGIRVARTRDGGFSRTVRARPVDRARATGRAPRARFTDRIARVDARTTTRATVRDGATAWMEYFCARVRRRAWGGRDGDEGGGARRVDF